MPSTVWSSIVSRLGGNKRAAEEEEDARPAKSRKTKEPSKASYAVTPRQLVMLGGFWEGVPPFNGDEDRLYRWLAEPALWARLVMNDLEPRVQQRIVQLHAGIHDGLDASGFVCWRTLPPLQPGVRVSLRAYGLKGTSVDLPRVTIKQLQFLPSSRFAAAIVETPFPAERLLRSLVNAGKDDELLYIDAIVADRYGAAYRLLCDLVAERRALHPERRLVVVLMSVVSSDCLSRYARWGFSYGGLVGSGSDDKVPLLVDRIDRLLHELKRFEASIAKAHAPSPCSVVDDTMH
ncbi:hypothetical protein Ctob_005460 [Chrysochromulina tobinii]|uniref:Uncharacterized protein n=1 Tax=Chrysochromulina tobinii TaxID=1460289 RepID=A0A0M0K6K0_9EUKA|nr:hypothetical protein Ctob_005460 [Chrysochromulina tobinii]|eukprot:KOO34242.1 hypothetical protein Ctob_005460 [Chrysochromulina sp. CCMP291]